MRPVLMVMGLVAGLLAGVPAGWCLRGTVSRWCSRCGRAVGHLCARCVTELSPPHSTVVVVREDHPLT